MIDRLIELKTAEILYRRNLRKIYKRIELSLYSGNFSRRYYQEISQESEKDIHYVILYQDISFYTTNNGILTGKALLQVRIFSELHKYHALSALNMYISIFSVIVVITCKRCTKSVW